MQSTFPQRELGNGVHCDYATQAATQLSWPGDDTLAVLGDVGLDRATVDALVADGVVRQSSRR